MLALKSLYRHGKGEIRAQAIDHMRKIEKKREQLDMLVRLVEDEDQTVGSAAAAHLFMLEEEAREVLPAITALTKHRSVAVRRNAFTIQRALTVKKKEPR